MTTNNANESMVLPGRGCAGCTMCCKVLKIDAFAKPKGKWCSNCKIGAGCRIYDERPDECSTFVCGYLAWEPISEAWRPDKCKMVLVAELDGNRIAVVDPNRMNAWRSEPFYSDLKRLAQLAAEVMNQVVVCIDYRAIVILPDSDVDLGVVAPDELIVTEE
ncbi:MAG: hypothetical protein HQ519_03785 [Planctomycetes bacterium]|nr:hypothetical protein [Planctomycetota bacterium]